MNLWQRFLYGNLPEPMRRKAAFDMTRVGVQGRPQYPDTSIEKLQRQFSRNEIVYAAIRAKMAAATDPRMFVESRTGNEPWKEVPGHPLRRLLMRPNSDMDEAAFLKAAIASSDIAGRFYAEIVRAKNGLPIELHPLNAAKVAPIPGDRGVITAYEFKDGSTKVTIPAENMIDWRQYDPVHRYQGLSPLAVALGSVDADSAQTDFIREFFNNAGVPSGMLKIKGRTLHNDEAEAIKARWRTRFGRNWGGMHDIAVMDENAEYEKMGADLSELQSDVLREFTETRVSMVFGVPPLIIYAFAGLKRATYSNLKEAWSGFWDSTLTPMLKDWRTFLTWRLLTEFESEDLIYGERIRLNYDMSQVAALQEDVDAIQMRSRDNFKAGGITLNEFRARVGEPPDPNGDYYLRGLALAAVGVGETAAATDLPKRKGVLPMAAKAMKATSTVTIERQIEKAMETYLFGQHEKVARAVEAGS
jgi:HK97 family phage portal protein